MKQPPFLKFAGLTLCCLLMLCCVSCQKSGEFHPVSGEIGDLKFSSAQWGMTPEETLKSLELTRDDAELFMWTPINTERNEFDTTLHLKKKIEIYGLSGQAIISFSDRLATVVGFGGDAAVTSESKAYDSPLFQNYLGLYRVRFLLDETDPEKIKQSVTKALGEPSPSERWQGGSIADWDNEEEKQAYYALFKDVDSLNFAQRPNPISTMSIDEYDPESQVRQDYSKINWEGRYYLNYEAVVAASLNNRSRPTAKSEW